MNKDYISLVSVILVFAHANNGTYYQDLARKTGIEVAKLKSAFEYGKAHNLIHYNPKTHITTFEIESWEEIIADLETNPKLAKKTNKERELIEYYDALYKKP